MKKLIIKPSKIGGKLRVPSSKSHTMRAIWFASMAEGDSRIDHILRSPDTDAMITACRQFGADIDQQEDTLIVRGVAGQPKSPQATIDCGNSGQVLRFCSAMAALNEHPITFDGDESIQQRRPMQAVIDGIQQLGGHAQSLQDNGLAPLCIHGPCKAGTATIDGHFAQPVSAMLMLATQLNGCTTIHASPLIEPSWVNLTLHWFDQLKINYTSLTAGQYIIVGPQTIPAFNYTVPGDASSAAFPLAAAIIHHQALKLEGLYSDDPQGDKQLLALLAQHGVPCHELAEHWFYDGQQGLQGGHYDISDFNDVIAILSVLACFATDTVTITGASNTQHKESNRLHAMSTELKKMGADIQPTNDGLVIQPSTLQAATVDSHNDHRIAMALAIAATATTSGETVINNVDCIDKSYPEFAQALYHLNGNIRIC